MSRPCRRSAATGVLRSEGFVGDVLEAEYAMPSRELTELLDLVAGGRAAMDGRTVSVAVVTLDYRLAPEHPHPAAVDGATALGASRPPGWRSRWRCGPK